MRDDRNKWKRENTRNSWTKVEEHSCARELARVYFATEMEGISALIKQSNDLG